MELGWQQSFQEFCVEKLVTDCTREESVETAHSTICLCSLDPSQSNESRPTMRNEMATVDDFCVDDEHVARTTTCFE